MNLPSAIDVMTSAMELAAIMRQDPAMIEKEAFTKGQQFLAVFVDDSFRGSFKDFDKRKIECFQKAIEDLSSGGQMLKTHTLGLTFSHGKIEHYESPHGQMPVGNIMFSIGIKNIVAFKNWRNQDGEVEIPQEELHNAIYALIVMISRLN